MRYDEAVRGYRADTRQEIVDREEMLRLIDLHGDGILTRQSERDHMTASGFIVNEACTHVLMVYHNIYNSWSWTGGHADGDKDLLAVALREAIEETGAPVRPMSQLPISLEILPVFAHFKRGEFVRAHMHLNVSYALIAGQDANLVAKPDENSGVQWIAIDQLAKHVTEPPMLVTYQKIIDRISLHMGE